MIEASNAVDNAVGDGTTSVIVLAGACKECRRVIGFWNPPIVIAEGYSQALEISLEFFEGAISENQQFQSSNIV